MSNVSMTIWGRMLNLSVAFDCYENEEVLPEQTEALDRLIGSGAIEDSRTAVENYCLKRISKRLEKAVSPIYSNMLCHIVCMSGAPFPPTAMWAWCVGIASIPKTAWSFFLKTKKYVISERPTFSNTKKAFYRMTGHSEMTWSAASRRMSVGRNIESCLNIMHSKDEELSS